MSEAAPAPAPVSAEAPKSGVNADPSQFNIKQAMDEWANLPAEEAKADAAKKVKDANDTKAEDIAAEYDGAQSSLVFDKEGKVRSEKSKVTRIDENGHVIHLDKRKVNKAADQIAELRDYQGDNLLTPNQAIPALREKRIEAIKAELMTIAGRSRATTKNGERELTSGPHARQLRAELHDLSSRKAGDGKRNTTTPTSPDAAQFGSPTGPAGNPDAKPFAPPSPKNTTPFGAPTGPAGNPNMTPFGPPQPRGNANTSEFAAPTERIFQKLDALVLPADQKSTLDDARKKFIELSAKKRGISFGKQRKLNKAEKTYTDALDAAGATIADQILSLGFNTNTVKLHSTAGNSFELLDLADKIQEQQEENANGKLLKNFNEWWAKRDSFKTDANGNRIVDANGKMQSNWKNKAVKGLALGAITFVPGIGIGLGAAYLATGLAGGAAAAGLVGGGIGRSLGKNLFKAHTERNAGAKTVAAEWSDNLRVQAAQVRESANIVDAKDISGRVMEQTKILSGANKKRLGAAALLGVGGAVGGYYAAGAAEKLAKGAFNGAKDLIGSAKSGAKNIGGNTGGPKLGGVVDRPNGSRAGNGGNLPHRPGDSLPRTGNGQPGIDPNQTSGTPNGQPGINPDQVPGTPNAQPGVNPEDIIVATGTPNAVPQGLIDASNFNDPYDWIQDTFKGQNATTKIHALEDALRKAGNTVELHNAGTNNEWVEINGISEKSYVINMLSSVNG